ncbi:MAG: isoprenylcysteine carboxylmethyltransferase family protein [Parafilimonas sp.]
MLNQHLILIILWIVFSLFHSIFAAPQWKKIMQQVMKRNFKYYRILYSVFASINLGIIIVYLFRIESITLWETHIIVTIPAISCMIGSGSLMIFFAQKFFFDLSGADIFLKTKKPETLIKTNLYKYVRHPLYAATLLFIWSIFFWHPLLSNLISCIIISIYTITGIRYEEKKLIHEFGKSYIQYRDKTPMLIPKLIIPGKKISI